MLKKDALEHPLPEPWRTTFRQIPDESWGRLICLTCRPLALSGPNGLFLSTGPSPECAPQCAPLRTVRISLRRRIRCWKGSGACLEAPIRRSAQSCKVHAWERGQVVLDIRSRPQPEFEAIKGRLSIASNWIGESANGDEIETARWGETPKID